MYLTAAVKEALRVYPPVPYVGRQTTEPVEINGYRIPVGTLSFVLCVRVFFLALVDTQIRCGRSSIADLNPLQSRRVA